MSRRRRNLSTFNYSPYSSPLTSFLIYPPLLLRSSWGFVGIIFAGLCWHRLLEKPHKSKRQDSRREKERFGGGREKSRREGRKKIV